MMTNFPLPRRTLPLRTPVQDLNIKDYKCAGPKDYLTCGYATDRAYANKLIKVIEDYGDYTAL